LGAQLYKSKKEVKPKMEINIKIPKYSLKSILSSEKLFKRKKTKKLIEIN
tara:strand:- start:6 stop:155 length:150 start_codon:yes stop_codon:yes gene_type:complete